MLTLILASVQHPWLQKHLKDPGHSTRSAGSRLQLNMCTPLTEWSLSGLTMLSWHSVGIHQSTKGISSHVTCQGMFIHSCLSCSLSQCGLIFSLKEWKRCTWTYFQWKKRVQTGNGLSNLHQIILTSEKKAAHHNTHTVAGKFPLVKWPEPHRGKEVYLFSPDSHPLSPLTLCTSWHMN